MTKPNQLFHIDNNFYHLTARQAKQLSIEKRLPRSGYAIRADVELLGQYQFGFVRGGEFTPFEIEFDGGWIQRTRLSWFNGVIIHQGWVWSIHIVQESPNL